MRVADFHIVGRTGLTETGAISSSWVCTAREREAKRTKRIKKRAVLWHSSINNGKKYLIWGVLTSVRISVFQPVGCYTNFVREAIRSWWRNSYLRCYFRTCVCVCVCVCAEFIKSHSYWLYVFMLFLFYFTPSHLTERLAESRSLLQEAETNSNRGRVFYTICCRLHLKCDGTRWLTVGGSEGEAGE